MSLTLLDLDEKYLDVVGKVIDADGEIDEQLEKEYDTALWDLIHKETNILHVDETIESQIKQGKEIVKRLQKRIKAFENQQKRLRDYLIQHMVKTNRSVIETELGKIRLYTSKSVANLPISEVDEKYVKTEIVQKVDKKQIKQDAKTDDNIKQKYILTNYFIKKH